MMILKRLFVLAIFVLTGTVALGQQIGQPIVSPAALSVGSTTTIMVSAVLRIPNIIPGSVNVQRLDPNGQITVAGLLNDNGVDGDSIAGDGIFSGHIVLSEPLVGAVGLRVSAAIKGSLRRITSGATQLSILALGTPVNVHALDISNRTIESATGLAIIANIVNACFSPRVSFSVVLQIGQLFNGTPVGRFSELGDCYQFEISPGTTVSSALAILQTRSEVSASAAEYIGSGADTCVGVTCGDPQYSRNLELPAAHNLSNGANVIVGVIDSGLDALTYQPPHFILGSNFTGPVVIANVFDQVGHGTAVASIVASTAPGSTLFINKVLDANNECTCAGVYQGLAEAISHQATIINMSLGFHTNNCIMLSALVTSAQNSGHLIVAAAGNDNSSSRSYPAANLNVVAVGNVDDRDQRYSDPLHGSNFGPWVNIAAPGVAIVAPFSGQSSNWTGTSFSAPFVSGTAALISSKYPSLSASDIRSQLMRTALPIPFTAGTDTCPNQPCNQDLGSGRLDPQASLGAVRITRSTAVGASGALVRRTLEITVDNSFFDTLTFLGQATGCEVVTVSAPPCIRDFPFDFGALPPGDHQIRLTFRDATADFFGSLQLTAPNTRFVSVITGSGTINPLDATRASFSLFGAGARNVVFNVTKS